jgi:hypothetical protein
MMWLAMAYSRLGIEAEMLRQEVATLRMELERMKGIRPVESPHEEKEHA